MGHPKGRYDLHRLDRRILDLIERNEAWQEQTLKSLDERARNSFPANYRMMQVWDLLGLYFCCQEPYEDYIEPVPTGAGGEGTRMTMRPIGERKVLFDPYPFDEPRLRIQLSCKRIPSRKFASAGEFREVYFKAPTELAEYELLAA